VLQCQALWYYSVKPFYITMPIHLVLQCQALWYNKDSLMAFLMTAIWYCSVKSYGITIQFKCLWYYNVKPFGITMLSLLALQ